MGRAHPCPPPTPHEWGGVWSSSDSLEPGTTPVGYFVARPDVARGRRQDVEEGLAVVAAEDPVVEDDNGAAVGRAPDQAPETLLQPQCGLRQRQLGEGFAHLLGARCVDGVCGHREWQPDDDDAAQALAWDVDALPERRRAEEQRAWRFFEALQQLTALPVDALAEDQNLVEVDALLERGVHVAPLAV